MGQALYRKYRSKSLKEIVGQEHITDTLSRALASGRISHAYLFSGPRGVGKTSIARILAHEINSLPYSDDSTHMDIIEIDAASNNSVEDVRELREKVFVAPSSAKYKVYIIDEVHMLSKAAFNALLKTLEEPPAHVVFILATTVASKLPDTIISRTQHYTFKPVEQAKVIDHLKFIAGQEGVLIDDEALALLAAHGEGSFRDSISLLDQARSIASASGEKARVSGAEVRQLLGIAPDAAIEDLLASIRSADADQASQLLGKLSQLYGQGLQAGAIASQLGENLRSGLARGKPALPVGQSLSLMKALIEVPASRSPERLLEIVLLEASATGTVVATLQPDPTPQPSSTAQPAPAAPAAQASPHKQSPAAAKPAKAAATASSPAVTAAAAAPEIIAVEIAKVVEVAVTAVEPAAPSAAATPSEPAAPATTILLDAAIWPQVLDSIKKEYNTLYGVLRMANPVFTADGIELQFKFLFHQKRLNEVKNKEIIADFIKRVTGSDVTVLCTFVKDAKPAAIAESSAVAATLVVASPTMEAISNIFGGGEIL